MFPSYKPAIGQTEVSLLKRWCLEDNISSAYLFWTCMNSGASLKTVVI